MNYIIFRAIEEVSLIVANKASMKNSRSASRISTMSSSLSKQKLNLVEVQLNGSKSSSSLKSLGVGSTTNSSALRNVDSRSSLLSSPKAEQNETLEIGSELMKRSADLKDFTPEDKELVVASMLSNPTVLKLLADATFNRNMPINQ